MSLRTPKRLLFLSADTMTVYAWRYGTLIDAHVFSSDPPGLNAFADYLQVDGGYEHHLLVDLVEEEFRVEHVPHVSRHDRHAMLRRTAAKRFRDTPFRTWTVLGREKGGRRDDRVRFCALTHPEPLQPWLDRLADAKAPLAAIVSVPLLTEQLYQALHFDAAPRLLVSRQAGGDLRQSFFLDGRVQFSRLTPGRWDGTVERVEQILEETRKTIHYLEWLQKLGIDEALEVVAIVDPATKVGLEARHGEADARLQWRTLDIGAAAEACGITLTTGAGDCNELLARLYFRRMPRNQYARACDRRHHGMHRGRRWLERGGAVLLGGVVVASAGNVLEASHLLEQARIASARAQEFTALNHRLVESAATDVEQAERYRDTVMTADYLRRHTARPAPAMRAVSRVLLGYPDFRIDHLRWQRQEDGAAMLTAPPWGNAGGHTVNARYERIHLDGVISPSDGNSRLAHARLETLLADLRKLPHAVESTASRHPVKKHRERSLKSEMMHAEFTVEVVFERDAED